MTRMITSCETYPTWELPTCGLGFSNTSAFRRYLSRSLHIFRSTTEAWSQEVSNAQRINSRDINAAGLLHHACPPQAQGLGLMALDDIFEASSYIGLQ